MESFQWTLLQNPIIIGILGLAVIIYSMLFKFCFLLPKNSTWEADVAASKKSLKIMISALPLLGLLGTIEGLMDTFAALSFNVAASLEILMANGISDALVTTQWGLALVVPALAFYTFLIRSYKNSLNLRL